MHFVLFGQHRRRWGDIARLNVLRPSVLQCAEGGVGLVVRGLGGLVVEGGALHTDRQADNTELRMWCPSACTKDTHMNPHSLTHTHTHTHTHTPAKLLCCCRFTVIGIRSYVLYSYIGCH